MKQTPPGPQPRRPGGSSDGGQFTSKPVADTPPSAVGDLSLKDDSPPVPFEMQVAGPDYNGEITQILIRRNGPGGAWRIDEEARPHEFIRAISRMDDDDQGHAEDAAELCAALTTEMLNNGDALPETAHIRTIRLGVADALERRKGEDGHFCSFWVSRRTQPRHLLALRSYAERRVCAIEISRLSGDGPMSETRAFRLCEWPGWGYPDLWHRGQWNGAGDLIERSIALSGAPGLPDMPPGWPEPPAPFGAVAAMRILGADNDTAAKAARTARGVLSRVSVQRIWDMLDDHATRGIAGHLAIELQQLEQLGLMLRRSDGRVDQPLLRRSVSEARRHIPDEYITDRLLAETPGDKNEQTPWKVARALELARETRRTM